MGLAGDGKTNDKGVPKNILELALIYELSESYIVGMPLFLQKGIFGALARVARWRGYDPEFSKYTKPDGLVEARTPPSGEAQPNRGRRSVRLYGLASKTSLRTLAALTSILALFFLLLRRGSHWSRRR